ncbi:MAG: polyhydroxyalkanoate synthesis repressor PhaR [Rhodobacteraceae bacterium]|nr:polyhydroxyalkanoate synthesis repressor PhaR [Paracoccaceae bacterium]
MTETGTQPLLIKRYASRRLYNTETSDYVTLEEIARFIREGREVRIIDLKSGDDLTRQYLLQIIAEHESRGENLLPVSVLTDLVRSYTDQAHAFLPDFLQASFDMMRENQSRFMEGVQQTISTPITAMQGIEEMQRRQREAMARMMGGWMGVGSEDDTQPEGQPDATARELEAIKAQLAELQSKLSKL